MQLRCASRILSAWQRIRRISTDKRLVTSSHSLDLIGYRDGVSLRDMRPLQSIGAGE